MKQLNRYAKTKKFQSNNLNGIMIRCLILFSFLFVQTNTFGQRELGVCDSTVYTLNADTTIIAGRNHLYLHTNNTINILYDFTSVNTNEYIRDFDIIKPDLWYTVVGRGSVGGNPARLYKSINRGQTWTLDTNHYNASNAQLVSQQFLKAINNLQHLNGDTLIMFMHYYESGIIYSTDLGLTWTKWFDNLITHYQGMFECDNKYYIYSYEGDGFLSFMFGFDKSLLFSSDSTELWANYNSAGYHPPCHNGDINCIFAPSNVSGCAAYNLFKNKVDSICSVVSVNNFNKKLLEIYPNPFNSEINIEGASGDEIYTLKNLYAQTIWTGKHIEQQEFYHLPSGIYFLTIIKGTKQQTLKLIKE